jgi:hypothetical protein
MEQNIGNSVWIYRDSVEEGKSSMKGFLIYGEIQSGLLRKALEIPTKEFIYDFSKFVGGNKPRQNLMLALEIESSEGLYIFHESSGSVLRCWVSKFGGNAQIDPYNLERYKNNPHWDSPEKITSDNIDSLRQQKLIVSMLEKYVSFVEGFYLK